MQRSGQARLVRVRTHAYLADRFEVQQGVALHGEVRVQVLEAVHRLLQVVLPVKIIPRDVVVLRGANGVLGVLDVVVGTVDPIDRPSADGDVILLRQDGDHGLLERVDGRLDLEELIRVGQAWIKSLLNPGTREMVLYLAKSQQRPSVAKADKTGWEAVGRYIYAFYDTAKFTRFAVPDATSSFKGLQDHHRFIGLCSDRRLAERDGPLRVVKGFCACDPCLVLKNEECLLQDVFGNMVHRLLYSITVVI
jgi:hypothetical protein